MIRYFLSIILLAMMFAACGNRTDASQQATSTDSLYASELSDSSTSVVDSDTLYAPMAADELFDDFIFNFAANTKLQKSRIHFPLAEVSEKEVRYIKPADWKMDYFFMRQDYYTLIFDNEDQMEIVKDTSIDHAVVEKIFLAKGEVKQYVFNRQKGAWVLQQIVHEPVAQSANSSFLQFFQRFASDDEFQAESLDDVVRFIGPDPDDDFRTMEGIITPDTWPAFAPRLPQKMIYNIIYGEAVKDSDEKIFVIRGIANGLEMELSFHRRDGKWKLTKMTT